MARRSIIFVDDEKALLNSLRRMLKPLEDDWQMAFVESGAQALVMMELVPVEVLVTDMIMPEMNGLELMDIIGERFPDVTRVMMTGQNDYEIYRNGMAISHYFLWKPVQPSAMRTMLQLLSGQEVGDLLPEDLGS